MTVQTSVLTSIQAYRLKPAKRLEVVGLRCEAHDQPEAGHLASLAASLPDSA